jgi:hypothetical protein
MRPLNYVSLHNQQDLNREFGLDTDSDVGREFRLDASVDVPT